MDYQHRQHRITGAEWNALTMPDLIARRWRVWTAPSRAGELEPYLQRTGVGDALATPGNIGALLLRRADGDQMLFELTTLWRSLEAIRAFAGDHIDQPVLYPEDEAYFVAWDDHVEHFAVAAHNGWPDPAGS